MTVEYNLTEEQEQVVRILRGPQFNRTHGGLYDRGVADSYYGRGRDPHWWSDDGVVKNLTPEEIAEYNAGYNWNERYGDKKDWA